MAKEVTGFIKLQIKGGAANPSPPVGPALGSKGLNIMDFCKQFNARTQESAGKVLPVVITVYSDKSFSFEVKQPPVAVQLKEAAKISTGSAEPNRKKVGTVTWDQVKAIAESKMPDMNCLPVKEPPLTFGRYLTKEQIMRITAIATANYLFSFYGDPQDDIRSLLECKKDFHLVAANIRNVAVMFDTLYEIGLISRGWQTVIEKRGLLYSKNGIPVTASSLSSALSSIKKKPTAMIHAIRMMVMEKLSNDK